MNAAIPADGAHRRGSAAATGLWVFIMMASVLFSLFIMAYVMRMAEPDWIPIRLPRQLWLSTAMLIAGSVLLQQAADAARAWRVARSYRWLMAGGICALAFLGSQLWAWQTLLDMRVLPAGNPASSFFFLLTAMHGLHVAGGLAGWFLTARAAWGNRDPALAAHRITLCARYWHFLLAVWLALFATLGLMTPEMARVICGIQ